MDAWEHTVHCGPEKFIEFRFLNKAKNLKNDNKDYNVVKMKIEIDVSTEDESTAEPWWLIIDPKQMMSPKASTVAIQMITGPFFSREEAENVLKSRRYNFSSRARVWCHSGCDTIQYKKKYREALAKNSIKKSDNN